MPIPPHIACLREHVGHVTLLAPAAAAIIRDEQGQVLLIRRSDGRGWSLPGGVMEPGERIADCLVRVTREETGLEVEPVRLIGLDSDPAVLHVTFANGDQAHLVSATFECRIVGGRLCPDGKESWRSPTSLQTRCRRTFSATMRAVFRMPWLVARLLSFAEPAPGTCFPAN